MKTASEALTSALLGGLASRGIQATLIPESSGTPDATVEIVKWDPGSRAQRWFPGVGGHGETLVTFRSMSIDGTARGWVRAGWFGGSDENSAEAVGDLMAMTIATGSGTPAVRSGRPGAH